MADENLRLAFNRHIEEHENAELNAAIERQKDEMAKMLSITFDKGMAYTNLIILGGYAGAFTIWNFTKDSLHERAEIWVAMLLCISLLTFISFEVFKMIYGVTDALQARNLIVKQLPANEFLKEFEDLRNSGNRKGMRVMLPVWVVQLSIAVASALAEFGILLYNFFAILISLPQWPT
jgi:hypothetical protein